MTAVGISASRIVPISEDLTQEDLRLAVLRGTEKMFRVDKPVAAGVSLVDGEWGVLNDEGKVERPGVTAVPNTYLCFAGTDRFDAHATGQVTLIMNSKIIVKTTKFDVGGPGYHVGDYLTVKGDAAVVTLAADGEPRLAKVNQVGDGFLVYEVL